MSTTYQSDFSPILASYKGRNAGQNRTVTGDNLRACDPSPYDIITGEYTKQTLDVKAGINHYYYNDIKAG
eukprot:5160974-Pyramimonas_sp.AAC.1